MGMDPDAALDDAIKADNTALESLAGRNDIVSCIHLCRGNNRSQWYAEGGYDPIAEKLFNELKVDAFSDCALCIVGYGPHDLQNGDAKITGGNVTKAARLAGRNRTEFYRLLERHSIEPSVFKVA